MFDRLTSSLGAALKSLSGRGRLTEENISETVREVRLALLDADVALPVVKTFTDAVKARAVGVEVTKSLTPGQAFIKVVHEELTRLMGEPSTGLNLRAQRPVVVMLAGLQGAGKTTSAGKLARWLKEKQNKKGLMVSTDVYRPAAILQLETLAAQVGAGFAPADASEAPVAIAKRLELQNGRGTIHVGADHQHFFVLFLLQPAREFAGARGLAGTLQTGEHDHDRTLSAQVEAGARLAHETRQFLMHDLDEGLARREAFRHLHADRTRLDGVGESLDDRQRDIGVKQRETNLAHGFGDVLLGEPAAAGKRLQRSAETAG